MSTTGKEELKKARVKAADNYIAALQLANKSNSEYIAELVKLVQAQKDQIASLEEALTHYRGR